jgi:hypothetical protein
VATVDASTGRVTAVGAGRTRVRFAPSALAEGLAGVMSTGGVQVHCLLSFTSLVLVAPHGLIDLKCIRVGLSRRAQSAVGVNAHPVATECRRHGGCSGSVGGAAASGYQCAGHRAGLSLIQPGTTGRSGASLPLRPPLPRLPWPVAASLSLVSNAHSVDTRRGCHWMTLMAHTHVAWTCLPPSPPCVLYLVLSPRASSPSWCPRPRPPWCIPHTCGSVPPIGTVAPPRPSRCRSWLALIWCEPSQFGLCQLRVVLAARPLAP